MVAVSATSVLLLQVDADQRPTALEAMQEGDTFVSGIMPTNVRQVVESYEDLSATIGKGTIDAAVSGAWQGTFTNFGDTSAGLVASRASLLAASAGYDEAATWQSVSGTKSIGGFQPTLATNLYANDKIISGIQTLRGEHGQGFAVSSAEVLKLVGPEDIQVGISLASLSSVPSVFGGLSGSTAALNIFSGSVESSTFALGASAISLIGFSSLVGGPSASVGLGPSGPTSSAEWNEAYAVVDGTFGDIGSVKTDLTLESGNDLILGNRIIGAPGPSNLVVSAGDKILWLNAAEWTLQTPTGNIYLDNPKDLFLNLISTSATLNTFSGNMETSTAGLSSLTDGLSGIVDSWVAAPSGMTSAVFVGNGSSVEISGADGEAVEIIPRNQSVLVLNTAAKKARWKPSVFVYDDSTGDGVVNSTDINDIDFGDATTHGSGEQNFSTAEFLMRTLKVGNTLSAGPDCSAFITSAITVSGGNLSSGPDCHFNIDGSISLSGNLSGAGNIGVIGQIVCGQTGPGTADLYVRDDNSDATIEINSGSNNDSLILFREDNSWRTTLGWDGGDNDFIINNTGTGDINLDPGAGYSVSTSCSSVIVSSMPLPGAFSNVAATDVNGVTAASWYFPSGHAIVGSPKEFDDLKIAFNSTESYFSLSAPGWYEADCNISIQVVSSPETITGYIVTTTGWGGTEAVVAQQAQVMRTNIDPHQCRVHGIFHIDEAKHVAFKFAGSGGDSHSAVRGNSAWIKRIA